MLEDDRRRDASEPRAAPTDGIRMDDLHPRVQAAGSSLYRDGQFASAILDGCMALEELIRASTGLALAGTQLMDAALGGQSPRLSVAVEPGVSGRNEQRGFHSLTVGLMLAVRNPKAHLIVDQRDPVRTFEYLAFTSILMHRIDAATAAPEGRTL